MVEFSEIGGQEEGAPAETGCITNLGKASNRIFDATVLESHYSRALSPPLVPLPLPLHLSSPLFSSLPTNCGLWNLLLFALLLPGSYPEHLTSTTEQLMNVPKVSSFPERFSGASSSDAKFSFLLQAVRTGCP